MSSPKKNLFLQKKRSLSLRPKDSNNIKKKKSSKITIIKGPWSKEEDELLKNWIEKNGPKGWTKCAENIPGRTGKQCREHWNNSLNSNIVKGNWSSEEDYLIMLYYKKYNGSWKKMIPIFKTRTENSIKNRFFSQLRKIASRYIKTGKKEYSTKFGLDILLKYYDMGLDEAKELFLKESNMNENNLEIFINNIENLIKNKPKDQKFIELENKIKKNNNDINNDNNEIKENNNINDKINQDNKDIETISKKNTENKKQIINEENKKSNINPEDTKTHDDTFDIIIHNDDDNKVNKQKINEKSPIPTPTQNLEEKNENKNNEIEINKKEYPIINNNKDIKDINNTNEKNQIYNNNFVNTINYNINNTINYNINNNNNYNGMNYNYINNNNYTNLNDNYNFSNSMTNFTNNINNYPINIVRNNSFNINNNYNNNYNNYFYKKDTNNNIFNFYPLISKKSSDISEFCNRYEQVENNPKQIEVNPNDVFQLLNRHNLNNGDCNNEYTKMNSGNIDNSNLYSNNGFFNNQNGRNNNFCNDEKKNLLSPIQKYEKNFQFQNEGFNSFSFKRSDSGIFSSNINNQCGFKRFTSFGSIKESKINENDCINEDFNKN